MTSETSNVTPKSTTPSITPKPRTLTLSPKEIYAIREPRFDVDVLVIDDHYVMEQLLDIDLKTIYYIYGPPGGSTIPRFPNVRSIYIETKAFFIRANNFYSKSTHFSTLPERLSTLCIQCHNPEARVYIGLEADSVICNNPNGIIELELGNHTRNLVLRSKFLRLYRPEYGKNTTPRQYIDNWIELHCMKNCWKDIKIKYTPFQLDSEIYEIFNERYYNMTTLCRATQKRDPVVFTMDNKHYYLNYDLIKRFCRYSFWFAIRLYHEYMRKLELEAMQNNHRSKTYKRDFVHAIICFGIYYPSGILNYDPGRIY